MIPAEVLAQFADYPHRRWNPLKREWVLVSPHRTKRPWQGQVESSLPTQAPRYDPSCYLCPGNVRAGGQRNPPYAQTFVFENDFAALLADAPTFSHRDGLFRLQSERGICRVICFSPDHSLTLSQMDQPSVEAVVEEWVRQFQDLSAMPFLSAVQIFENRGAMMGASNPHPHGQVWATEHRTDELVREAEAFREDPGLLLRYAEEETRLGTRVVVQNEAFLAVVPFWAVWPFETLVLPRRPHRNLASLSAEERTHLAALLRELTARYDALFDAPFPYSMGFHQIAQDEPFQLHAHFYPPLLRSATVRKFLVGFEMLGNPQRDITPEQAAERLRVAI